MPTSAPHTLCATQNERSSAKHDGLLKPVVALGAGGGGRAPTGVSVCAPPPPEMSVANPTFEGEEPHGPGPSWHRHPGANAPAVPSWWNLHEPSGFLHTPLMK